MADVSARTSSAAIITGTGNLLGDAVDVAAAEQDLAGRYADHFPVGVAAAQNVAGVAVGALVEEREHDPGGPGVVVDLGAGQPVAGLARLGALD
jgi:hypothetical protein